MKKIFLLLPLLLLLFGVTAYAENGDTVVSYDLLSKNRIIEASNGQHLFNINNDAYYLGCSSFTWDGDDPVFFAKIYSPGNMYGLSGIVIIASQSDPTSNVTIHQLGEWDRYYDGVCYDQYHLYVDENTRATVYSVQSFIDYFETAYADTEYDAYDSVGTFASFFTVENPGNLQVSGSLNAVPAFYGAKMLYNYLKTGDDSYIWNDELPDYENYPTDDSLYVKSISVNADKTVVDFTLGMASYFTNYRSFVSVGLCNKSDGTLSPTGLEADAGTFFSCPLPEYDTELYAIRYVTVTPTAYYNTWYRGKSKTIWFNYDSIPDDPDNMPPSPDSTLPGFSDFKYQILSRFDLDPAPPLGVEESFQITWEPEKGYDDNTYLIIEATGYCMQLKDDYTFTLSDILMKDKSYRFLMNKYIQTHTLPNGCDKLSMHFKRLVVQIVQKQDGKVIKRGKKYVFDVSKITGISPYTPPFDIYDPDQEVNPDGSTDNSPVGGGGNSDSDGFQLPVDFTDLTNIFKSIIELVQSCISAAGAVPRLMSTVFSFLPGIYQRGFYAFMSLTLLIGVIKLIRGS